MEKNGRNRDIAMQWSHFLDFAINYLVVMVRGVSDVLIFCKKRKTHIFIKNCQKKAKIGCFFPLAQKLKEWERQKCSSSVSCSQDEDFEWS
jgi:hypothetical protein